MSAIQVEQIKRNRHETGGLKHIPVPSTNEICVGAEFRCFACGGCK
jgi:hypothetical protein